VIFQDIFKFLVVLLESNIERRTFNFHSSHRHDVNNKAIDLPLPLLNTSVISIDSIRPQNNVREVRVLFFERGGRKWQHRSVEGGGCDFFYLNPFSTGF